MKTLTIVATTIALGLMAPACKKAPKYTYNASKGEANIEPSKDDGDPLPPVEDGGGETFALQCAENSDKGLRALRKLSNIELINTVSDVFGVSSGLDTSEFAEDIQKNAGGFDTAMTEANFVDQRRLEGYIKFAGSVAEKVDIASLFPCVAQGASCFATVLPKLGASAFRRPLTTEELTNLKGLGTQLIVDGLTPADAAKGLIQALVSSRGFLYRTELGVKTAGGDYELDDYELASALSYLIVRRPPDATLLKLAESGSLKPAIKAQAERLLALPAAKAAWNDFADMWLVASAVESHSSKVAEFTPAAKAAMAKETKDFFVQTLFDSKKGTFEQLLTADYSYAGAELQWLYDSPAVGGKVMFKDEQRRGLLSQGAFLASHATDVSPSPVTRGAYVMKKMLCTDFIGAPPSSPINGAAANNDGRKLRKESKACNSCHDTIDPVGFSFDVFDQVGRFREKDETGAVINTQNTLVIDGKEVTYEGPAELSQAIARSNQGVECFSRQLYRYGMGRMEWAKMSIVGASAKEFVASNESNVDACYISNITGAIKEADGNTKAGILAFVTSPGFILRSPVTKAPTVE